MAEREASWLPLAVGLAVVVLWGATPVATKLATREIDPLVVALVRTALGGFAAAPLALLLRIGLPPRRLLMPFGLSAFCAFVGFPVTFTLGQRLTSAMHGGLILAVLPMFTGVIAAVVERRRPAGRWWLGCAIAFAGEVLLVAGRAPTGASPASLGGDMLVLLSCVFAATSYVAGARLTQARYASLGTTLWGVSAMMLLIAPALPLTDGGALPTASPLAWGAVFFLAWITSMLGYVGWYWALGHGGITRMGTIQFLQPLSGLVLAFFLLGERPSLMLLLATMLIFAGVIVARRS
jgi:drug/metabolite transporter (DMT)-like permease